MPNVSKKSQILKSKSQKAKQLFLTPTASKKVKFVNIGVKKANLATLAQLRSLLMSDPLPAEAGCEAC